MRMLRPSPNPALKRTARIKPREAAEPKGHYTVTRLRPLCFD